MAMIIRRKKIIWVFLTPIVSAWMDAHWKTDAMSVARDTWLSVYRAAASTTVRTLEIARFRRITIPSRCQNNHWLWSSIFDFVALRAFML